MHWKGTNIRRVPVYCIGRRQYQRYLDISVAQLVASMSGVVLGVVVEVVGSNIARGKVFTSSTCIDSVLCI